MSTQAKYFINKVNKLFVCALIFFFFFILAPSAHASIVLKLVVVNPSDALAQTMPVKVYLPKEAKPEDVIDRGDLEIGYDTQQGSYYVYGEYELEPSEILEREVELQDIWVIPVKELESLRQETEKINNLLKNTEFADRINFIYNTIIGKLDRIEESQKTPKANPEDHISQYRSHIKLIESIKTDLAVARSMLNKARPLSTASVWKLMVFTLIFLGILGTSFYFIWSKQVKTLEAEGPPKIKPAEEPEAPQEEPKEEKEEEEKGEDDIEDIIRGE